MLTHGKKICKTLKEIRQQIAKNNDITLITSECHYKGECKGTCPKCEAEVRYLENELIKRRQLGKAVAIAGISLGMLGSLTECTVQQRTNKTHSNNNRKETIIKTCHEVILEGIVILPSSNRGRDFDESPEYFDISLFDVHRFPEKPPEPVGGSDTLYKFFASEIQYPKTGINATVVVEFIVEEDGSISNVKVLSGISPEVDQEVIRVIKMMPNWKAGEINGNLVRSYYTLPVKLPAKDK